MEARRERSRKAAGSKSAVLALSVPPSPASDSDDSAADDREVAPGFSRQFWKAGNYEAPDSAVPRVAQGVMEQSRLHPKFLHSNATSHKWALGALAELLDNAMDEVQKGATFVKIDQVIYPRDLDNPGLLVQDDGGGMSPDTMRECMSLGYSRKTTSLTIGRYGNGFKTSSMRLGADVILFSSCVQGDNLIRSVGMLSYTFLTQKGLADVVVPMISYEIIPEISKEGTVGDMVRKRLMRTTLADWFENLETLIKWSPYNTESELLSMFDDLGLHGTKIVVFNLWFNDNNVLELDFDADAKDIQLRRGEQLEVLTPHFRRTRKQLILQQHISERYHHSLRDYCSILYQKMPARFQIILRGEPVQHYDIVGDLLYTEKLTYKPQVGGDRNYTTSVKVSIGFARESRDINVHGFNVYHKNRLIMPFWKVLHENSSRGRGVIGVLQANFVEPAHDKQDFERTPAFTRLEARLKTMTAEYWNRNCDMIGYAPKAKGKKAAAAMIESSAPTDENNAGGGAQDADRAGPRVKTEPIEVANVSHKRPRTANRHSAVENLPGVTTGPIVVTNDFGKKTKGASEAGRPLGKNSKVLRVKTEAIDVVQIPGSSERADLEAEPVEAPHDAGNSEDEVPHMSSKRASPAKTSLEGKRLRTAPPESSPVLLRLVEESKELKARCIEYQENEGRVSQDLRSAQTFNLNLQRQLRELEDKERVRADVEKELTDARMANARLQMQVVELKTAPLAPQVKLEEVKSLELELQKEKEVNLSLRAEVQNLLRACSEKFNSLSFLQKMNRNRFAGRME